MSTMTKCPNCSKVLKLKSEAAFGKKVACPQCQEPFTVKPFKKKAKPVVEEPEDEYDDYGDTYDDYGDTYDDYGDTYDDYGGSGDDQQDDYEAAPKRSSSSSKKKKKKKKKAGLPPWLSYVAFGLAGVLVLGGLAAVVVMAVGSMGGSNVMNLAWLPGDADLFVKVEPDELWNSPMLKTVRESEVVKTMMDQATTNGAIKLEPADIDSVTLAGVDMIDMYQQRIGFMGGNAGGPQLARKADAKMIGVVRLKKDVTEADIGEGAADRKREHNGKTYYTSPGNQGLYLADPRTMIVGAEEEVKKAIDRGPSEPRVKRIDFANVSHQLVVVMAPPNLLDAEARAKVQSTSGTASQQKLGKALDQNSKAFCFGLSLKTNIEMEVQLQCFGSAEAEALKTELDTMLTEMKTQFASSTGALPPQMADFVAIGQETIDSLKTTKSGDEIILAASVPGRITTVVQDAIASNPMAGMMLQGMTQQFNQGATPPGFGAQGAGVNSLNPDPAQAGLPPAGNPEDFEAGVRQDQQNTLDTIGGIRGRIKSTTGSIQDAVPGGK